MRQSSEGRGDVDNGTLSFGVVLGLLVGAIVALFTFEKPTRNSTEQVTAITRTVREKLAEARETSDPVAESLAAGKAAARRRREELGQ